VTESVLKPVLDGSCTQCPRLARFLAGIRAERPDYFARPVPPFGDARAALLVVGLAPGMHGANRTGRPFTGDFAGILLYATLHKFGYASHGGSDDPRDGLRLKGCRVTNAVKCLPPDNKPEGSEVRRCNPFLAAELEAIRPRAVLALGAVAHQAVLRACVAKPASFPFAHRAAHMLPGVSRSGRARPFRLFDSYHCSRYNTQTKRLTTAMFEAVFRDIDDFLANTALR